MNKYVSILRLNNYDDIISLISKEEDHYVLENPYLISIEFNVKTSKQVLVMQHWLPVNLVKENVANLSIDDVLLELTPKQDIEEYYLNIINKDDDQSSKDEISTLLQSLDAKNNNQIH